MVGVIQRVFIPTGCLILLTFLLKINCLWWILWIPPWLNWLSAGCTHCTWVTVSSVSVYTGVLTTLKISRSKFNPSKRRTEEAIAKNQSLHVATKENVLILSSTWSRLISLRGCKPFLHCIALWLWVFSDFQEHVGSLSARPGTVTLDAGSNFRFMFHDVPFPLKVTHTFRFSISFESTLGN